MSLLVTFLTLIPAFAVSTFVARRVPGAGVAYPLAIVAGVATLVLVFLVMTFWMSLALFSTSGPAFGVD